MAFSRAAVSAAAISTVPSSSTSILHPVSSTSPRITLPPGPMTSRILSGLILMVTMRGAYAETSLRAVPNRLFHHAQDEQTRVTRLHQRAMHDLLGDAADLVVHLDRGHAGRGPRNLEVHVAQMILVAEDVGQHRNLVAFLDEAHRDAGDRRLDRHAGVHEREAAAAYRRHRGAAVGFEHFRDDADRCTGNSSSSGSVGVSARSANAP